MTPGGAQGLFTLLQHGVGTAVMDVIGGEHGDSAMAVLGVVPREERPAEGDGGVDIVESPGEAGVVLQGLDTCASEKGLSSLTWGRLPSGAKCFFIHTQHRGRRIWKVLGDTQTVDVDEARARAALMLDAINRGAATPGRACASSDALSAPRNPSPETPPEQFNEVGELPRQGTIEGARTADVQGTPPHARTRSVESPAIRRLPSPCR